MESNKKGNEKMEITTIRIDDQDISRIVATALTNQGYDVVRKPVKMDQTSWIVGEIITVYRTLD